MKNTPAYFTASSHPSIFKENTSYNSRQPRPLSCKKRWLTNRILQNEGLRTCQNFRGRVKIGVLFIRGVERICVKIQQKNTGI